MDEGTPLTEREKETLRLLLVGHDAKSIAHRLGLSVHTVNERLRDARRKLGVSSSREAARRLVDIEGGPPKSLADKDLGVAPEPSAAHPPGRFHGARGVGHPLAWLGGGMIIMSLIIVAIALSASFHAAGGGTQSANPPLQPVAAVAPASDPAAAASARSWVALVDAARWADSWNAAGTVFRSSISSAQWATMIAGVRNPLGAVASRTLLRDTRTNNLPGAPAGDYEVFQYRTDFAQKPGMIETVVLAHESAGWKVDGYFVK